MMVKDKIKHRTTTTVRTSKNDSVPVGFGKKIKVYTKDKLLLSHLNYRKVSNPRIDPSGKAPPHEIVNGKFGL